jgi:ankyrin repeat domain-containing protein 50
MLSIISKLGRKYQIYTYIPKVLRRAKDDESDSIRDILTSTHAVFFLGTPHRGSDLAPLGNTIRRIVGALGFDTSDRNIRALHFDSFELEMSREEFVRQWRRGPFQVRTFQESRGLAGFKGMSDKVTSPAAPTLTRNNSSRSGCFGLFVISRRSS